jgi:hypothetical protein
MARPSAPTGCSGSSDIRLNVLDQAPEIIEPSTCHGGRTEQGNP